jgi:hypothetical protein
MDIKGGLSFQDCRIGGENKVQLDQNGRNCIGPDGLNFQKDQKAILFDMK